MPHSKSPAVGVVSDALRVRRLQRWASLIPGWTISTIAVLERNVELTSALNLQWRATFSATGVSRPAQGVPRSQGCDSPTICFRHCSSASQLIALTSANQVVAIVLDCRHLVAEPLVALRLLNRSGIQLPTIAVADAGYFEVAPLLTECGCSAILTHLPVEHAICDFVSKATKGTDC